MPALNFAAQFADAVESGQKTQTIRLKRKRPIVAGDRLVLYTGQRTKQCRKLLETTCWYTQHVVIMATATKLDGVRLGGCDPNFFAQDDGFDSAREMQDWFRKRYGLPFRGQLIKWKFKETP